MSQKMTAAVVHEFGKPLTIDEVPIPTPAAGQVRILVMASGVCHTDLHAADGDWPVKPNLPFIPGHEAVGFVDAVGTGVTSVQKGDRVGVPWLHSACGECEYCTAGKRSAPRSKTPATRLTAALLPTCSRPQPTSRVCPKGSTLSTRRRCCVPV